MKTSSSSKSNGSSKGNNNSSSSTSTKTLSNPNPVAPSIRDLEPLPTLKLFDLENDPDVIADEGQTVQVSASSKSIAGVGESSKSKKTNRLLAEDVQSNDFWTGLYNNSDFWTCLYCGEKFLIKSALKAHASQHKDEKNFSLSQTCLDCGLNFPTFPEYSHHMQITGHMSESHVKPSMVRKQLQQQQQQQHQQQSSAASGFSSGAGIADLTKGLSLEPPGVAAARSMLPHTPPSPHETVDGAPLYQRFFGSHNGPAGSAHAGNGTYSLNGHSSKSMYQMPDINTSATSNSLSSRSLGPHSGSNLQATLFFGSASLTDYPVACCAWVLLDEVGGILTQGCAPVDQPIHHGGAGSAMAAAMVRMDYEGLINGVKAALNFMITRMKIKSSSETVLKQLSQSQSQSQLLGVSLSQKLIIAEDLNDLVMNLLTKFEQLDFELVSTEQNGYVQQLARKTLSAQLQPPPLHAPSHFASHGHHPSNGYGSRMHTGSPSIGGFGGGGGQYPNQGSYMQSGPYGPPNVGMSNGGYGPGLGSDQGSYGRGGSSKGLGGPYTSGNAGMNALGPSYRR